MDPYAAMSSVQAGPSSGGLRSALAVDQSLQHKSSLATTRSTSSTSASSSSQHSFPDRTGAVGATASSSPSSSTRPFHRPAYTETVQSPKTRTFEKPARLPIHVRIVPKDIWLRIHVEPSQTIGSIKDAALLTANAPDYDPSLSYRFYQDAVNASAHAKIAPVASHDKVVKHRTYALPRSIACPPPDLSDLAASLAASVAGTNRFNKRPSRSNPSPASVARPTQPPPVPPLPNFDSAYSPRQTQVALPPPSTKQYATASPRSRSIPRSLSSRALGTGGSPARSASSGDVVGSPPAPVARQISTSSLATSPPSATSDWEATSNIATISSDVSASETSHSHSSSAIEEVSVRLDASLVTGDRNAKLEEAQARSRLSQWHARREQSSPAHSCNSTPTIASSSTFDSEAASSPRMNAVSSPSFHASSAGSHAASGYAASPRADSLHPYAATPPRRPIRINPGSTASTAPPAIFYTQPGACESFNSLASLDSYSPPSASAALMTTQDDDTSIMQWGTQAEAAPLSEEPSSPSPAPSSTLAALSSPVQPSEALLSGSPSSSTSPLRPRSKTVTAADVLRSRSARDDVPPMPDVISSPVRNSSLPKTNIRKLVPETSQRRDGPRMELLDMLKGAPGGIDDDEGFSTVKQRTVRQATATPPILRKQSSGDAAAAPSSPFAAAAPADTRDLYIAGIRLDEISRGVKDASHPLSAKYAVLSSANGCELDEWKTVAAYRIRPYELLELQWSIPTERVYIPPISLGETLRVDGAASGGNKGMFDRTWGDEQDAGPDTDAPCLEPYFEGWVYVLKGANAGKASARRSTKMGKWKVHWLTVRGWRMDLYRKKPRAGEAVMPEADQVWWLRSVEWVMEDADNAVPGNAALPALDAMPRSSITAGFSPKAGTASAGEVPMLTIRCITHFDHEALSTLLLRAWFRCSAAKVSVGTDNWRRKAVFRAVVAGRGGTAAPGRAGRGGRGGRNAKSRMRLRPSGWAKEWEDADQWSSDSEREEVGAPAELEHILLAQQQQERRDTVTQAKADDSARQKGRREHEAGARGIVPNGLYAALLGRTSGSSGNAASSISGDGGGGGGGGSLDASPYHQGTARQRHLAQSPSLPHIEPGLMLGSTSQYKDSRRHSKSVSRSPPRSRSPEPWIAPRSSAARGRSTPGSMHSSASSRNVSREASPMPSRKGSASGGSVHSDPYAMSPALVPGFVDAQPPPSVMLLKRFKASQERAKGANRDDHPAPT
ncbi:hypothetical protein PHSY_001458 [Pseudozyma hubeiensis SY62]|uniref:Uncharacterized protein n=1 Tax=Pseudozyma hubeiensis (strain SY62) TaxID=1305764 RepID=R9P738_PSEHS|nr:hypothetical protein PHSY_001458 [Pseudozyma hubeiensis SY62]GAC93890.1 hypothetical protein PHSY_001458 [Pseudozyma hubeiensis SY62]